MNWITPIIDRTQSDVDYLKTLASRIRLFGWDNISEVEQYNWLFGDLVKLRDAYAYKILTSDGEELQVSDRGVIGAFNVWDVQRIVNNVNYTRDYLINDLNLQLSLQPLTLQYSIGGIPTKEDIDMVRDYVLALMNETIYYSELVQPNYTGVINYTELNSFENMILNFKETLEKLDSPNRSIRTLKLLDNYFTSNYSIKKGYLTSLPATAGTTVLNDVNAKLSYISGNPVGSKYDLSNSILIGFPVIIHSKTPTGEVYEYNIIDSYVVDFYPTATLRYPLQFDHVEKINIYHTNVKYDVINDTWYGFDLETTSGTFTPKFYGFNLSWIVPDFNFTNLDSVYINTNETHVVSDLRLLTNNGTFEYDNVTSLTVNQLINSTEYKVDRLQMPVNVDNEFGALYMVEVPPSGDVTNIFNNIITEYT